MALTPSTMLPLGTEAPDFQLRNLNPNWPTQRVALSNFHGRPGLLVMFLCNHCPYVKHIADHLAALTAEAIDKGIGVVAIMSNDATRYTDDAPDKIADECKTRGYAFPYLHDENQEVAHAYHAACTPDFFLFDRHQKLFYRGQLDPSRPGNDKPLTGQDLRHAIQCVLDNTPPPDPQIPSMGCNIKWKPGNEPDYFG